MAHSYRLPQRASLLIFQKLARSLFAQFWTFWSPLFTDNALISARVRAERLWLFTRNTAVMCSATLVNALFVGVIFWPLGPSWLAWICLAFLTLASSYFLWHWWRQRRREKPVTVSQTTERKASLRIVAISFAWAILIATLYPLGDESHHLLLIFVSAGMAAGAATTMATLPVAVMAAISLFVLPILGHLIVAGGAINIAMSVMAVLFAVSMIVVARNRYLNMIDNVVLYLDLEYSRNQLAARIDTRTRDLAEANRQLKSEIIVRQKAEAALREAKEHAEAASQSKSNFMANMSHELRTPLTSIIGFAQILEQQTFGPVGHRRYAEYAGDICNSAEHLLDLINDLIDIARIESGGRDLRLEAMDLGAFLPPIVDMFSDQAAQKRCHIQLCIESDLPALTADRRAVKQMLMNLLSNALKYSDHSDHSDHSDQMADQQAGQRQEQLSKQALGTVIVSAYRQHDQICLQVTDGGVGIRQENLCRVMMPFNRVYDGNAALPTGSGLGLSIVKALVEKHGGQIAIESEHNVGTKVRLQFPITAKNAPPLVAEARSA